MVRLRPRDATIVEDCLRAHTTVSSVEEGLSSELTYSPPTEADHIGSQASVPDAC
jgi:hypothetical protein